jgi:hypothetical protein
LSLTAEACLAVIADAGLTPDYFASYPGADNADPGYAGAGVTEVMDALGLRVNWYLALARQAIGGNFVIARVDPSLDEDNTAFWTGGADGELRIAQSNEDRHPSRSHRPEFGGNSLRSFADIKASRAAPNLASGNSIFANSTFNTSANLVFR